MRDRLRRRWRQLSEDPAPPAEPLRSPRAPPDAQMQPASCHAPQFPPNVAPVAQAALVYGPPVFFETGHVRAEPSPRTPARVCATPTAAHHQLHPKPRCGRRRAAHYVARVDLSASPRDRLQNRSNRCGQDRAPLGHLATGAALGLLHGRPRSVFAWCAPRKWPVEPRRSLQQCGPTGAPFSARTGCARTEPSPHTPCVLASPPLLPTASYTPSHVAAAIAQPITSRMSTSARRPATGAKPAQTAAAGSGRTGCPAAIWRSARLWACSTVDPGRCPRGVCWGSGPRSGPAPRTAIARAVVLCPWPLPRTPPTCGELCATPRLRGALPTVAAWTWREAGSFAVSSAPRRIAVEVPCAYAGPFRTPRHRGLRVSLPYGPSLPLSPTRLAGWLPACLPACLSVRPPAYLPARLPACLHARPSARDQSRPPTRPPACRPPHREGV